jgi:DNA ligase-1
MLATPYEERYVSYPCVIQPKLDGVRAIYFNEDFYTRRGEKWSRNLVGHFLKEIEETELKDRILDGEFWHWEWPFQRINAAIGVNRHEPNHDTFHISYNIFDVIEDRPFHERHLTNGACTDLQLTHHVYAVRVLTVKNKEYADWNFEKAVEFKQEGIIYRIGDCRYQQDKRSTQLLKRKVHHEEEFLVLGVEAGKEYDKNGLPCKYSDTTGRLVCSSGNGKIFRVGSGLTDEQRDAIWKNPGLIEGHKIRVRYDSLSTAGIPLKPRITSIC